MRPRNTALVGLLLLLCLPGCRDVLAPPVTPEPSLSRPNFAKSAAEADSSAVHLLARALALSMRDSKVRRQVLEDLRDSPFPRHKLDLKSYLRGARGRSLADAGARASGGAIDDLLRGAD